MAVIDRIHAIGTVAWVRFVQSLNAATGSILAIVLVINASYPQFVSQIGATLPTPVKFAGVIGFAALVHYALRRAAKASG